MRRPFSLRLYAAATAVANLVAPLLLRRRAGLGKEDPDRLAERRGRPSRPRPQGPLVWVHAVSVGEAMSALPLISRLRGARSEVTILLTTGTRSSAEILAARLPDRVVHQFAPLDTPQAVGRFLDHWRPGLAVLVESELWPNLILATRASGARLALVSARISERSARGWAHARGAASTVLNAFDLILAQDDQATDRLTGLGGRVDGRLNLKEVAEPLPADPATLAALSAGIGGRSVILAASTHEGEEAMIAAAVAALPSPAPLLVIAPRHPSRAEAVARSLAPATISRRTRGEPIGEDTRYYLADTLGELGLFYRLADICVMGGSLVPGVGGHNPLEPARLGCAIVSGPHVANAQSIYDAMAAAGCLLPVTGAEEMTATLDHLLANEPARDALGRSARAFAEHRRDDWDAAWARLEPMVPRT